MHYVIVGCGRVGRSLTTYLLDHNHTVALIDKSPDAFRKVPRQDGLTTLVGIGFDRDILESASIATANGVAAVTSGDNSNIVIARIAKEIYQVPHVTARIYDSTRAHIYQRLGISTVASTTWATDQFIKRIASENDISDWVDPTGNVVIIERLIPSSWAGHSCSGLYNGDKFAPIVITHIGNTHLTTPHTKIHEDDRIFIACSKQHLDELDSLLAKGPSS